VGQGEMLSAAGVHHRRLCSAARQHICRRRTRSRHDGEGKLVYAGRVGTGFSEKVAAELYARLETMRAPGSMFAKELPDARGVRFVRPELVASVEFRSWTPDGLVRHAVFLGYGC
jgi:ATP-dependent DNA ligase